MDRAFRFRRGGSRVARISANGMVGGTLHLEVLKAAGICATHLKAYMDGLWTAKFGSSDGSYGTGVLTLRDGKVSGGDSLYFYSGIFVVRNNIFHAELTITPYVKDAVSVFGTRGEKLTLNLAGRVAPDGTIVAHGSAKQRPGIEFGAVLTKQVANL